MRINKYIALATGLSRRGADTAILEGRVAINGKTGKVGDVVNDTDKVRFDNRQLSLPNAQQTIMLNKPMGYVCSRDGQGSRTIYDLLPSQLHHLKPVGRLDKNSSGLLLLTTDGELAQRLTHPSYQKSKTYIVELDRSLNTDEIQQITEHGVDIGDERRSSFALKPIKKNYYQVTLTEGRNRQIRRTFEAIESRVLGLHRTTFGEYTLGRLKPGEHQKV